MPTSTPTVHQGDLLAVIDPRVYEGQLLQAQANLANSRANLAASKANLANAQAKAVQAKADYDRATDLTKQGIMSPQNFDAAKATSVSADAQVKADQALDQQAEAQVSQQEAALNVAETNLAYTKIYAPIDGTVIDRAVDVGQTVTAGFTTPTLFTIAQDLTKMQLHISTDEGDIGAVRRRCAGHLSGRCVSRRNISRADFAGSHERDNRSKRGDIRNHRGLRQS